MALNARTRRRGRRRRPRHRRSVELAEECELIDEEEEIDHVGLAKSIDEEYKLEEAKLALSFWDVYRRERQRPLSEISERSRQLSPWQRTRRRMMYRRGDADNKYVLMSDRMYGNPKLLDKDHLTSPPTLDDLNQEPDEFKNTYWVQPIFRVFVVALAYLSFPYWVALLAQFETTDPEEFNTVVSQLAPTVGVLYATILALTLQVLYQRFSQIQESATTESTLLSQITRNVLSLFANEPEWANDACQMIANQIRIMLSRTRGVELLSIMKSDTYSNLLALIDDYHYVYGCTPSFSSQKESVVSMLRTELTQIMEVRATRLSNEANALPPTHFVLLTSLTLVSLTAYVTASLAVIDDLAHPPQEASLLFAGLAALYLLFFNFCKDLNGPFKGVYQIKRSNAVSHLLQAKWLITNQVGERVSFGVNFDEDPPEEPTSPLINKIKAFFNGGVEDIATVESDTMSTLAKELGNTNVERNEKITNIAQFKENTNDDTDSLQSPMAFEPVLKPQKTADNLTFNTQGDNGNYGIESANEAIPMSKSMKKKINNTDETVEAFDPASYFRQTSGFAS